MARRTGKPDTDLSNLPDDALLRLPDVLRLFPVGKSTWWEGVKNGTFPKPVELGPRARGWRLGDVLALTRKSEQAQGGRQ